MNWPAFITALIAIALSIIAMRQDDENWKETMNFTVLAAAFLGASWAFLIADLIGQV